MGQKGSNPYKVRFDAPGDVNHQGRAESQTNDLKKPCKGCTLDVKWV